LVPKTTLDCSIVLDIDADNRYIKMAVLFNEFIINDCLVIAI